MNKLLNRFAWFISITLWLAIVIYIDNDFFIAWLILWIVIKRIFLSENFIKDRLEFFAESIKNNYSLEKEKQNIKSPINPFHKEDINIEYKEEKNINLQEIEEVKTVDTKIKVEEKVYIEPENFEPTKFDLLIERISKYIKDFFSTNTIAKIWAVILFFVVIYFLKWFATSFWDIIWPVGRLILGFLVSVIIFGFWIKLEKTDAKHEWMILIWLSILLNFAIILSWRYLIWENFNGSDWFLTSWITFILLILNTVFWVVTSLVYNSRILLIFSFIFAYLNPFIIWANSDWTPYVLIWYSLIISLWALFLANKQKSILLFAISFILWNLLFLIAPVSDNFWALSKLIVLNIFNIAAIYSILNFDKKYNTIIEYLFWGVFLIIWMFYISIQNFINIDLTLYLSSIASVLLFLFISYYLSKKKALLYAIWTLWTIFSLGLLVSNNIDFIWFKTWIIALLIFAISNWLMPFINDKLLKKKNFNSLIIWSILWVWFIGFQIYNFGEEHFKWLAEWLAFLALAIVYFFQSFFITQKIWIEKMRGDEDLKNIFYSFAGISISLFSIAVAFIFSDYPEIVSAIWLFEATILYYFYSKNSSIKVFIAATVLFAIWLSKFGILLDNVESWDYKFLISFVIILASFMLNLFFINKAEKQNNNSPIIPFHKEDENIIWINIHSIWHLFWMWIMWGLLLQIIPSTGHWWSLFWISIFITILWYFYAKFNIKFLKIVFIIIIGLFWIFHIWELNSVFYKLERDDLDYIKNLQYIVSAIFISNIIIWEKVNKVKSYNKIILILVSLYAFIISNFYILDIFGDLLWHFSLTIYWGLIASILLFIWISKDIIRYRTIWLYFLWLTTAKIFLFDIWFGMDWDSRFMALWVLWVIFIVISTLYTKRYWNNILWELNVSNLKTVSHLTSIKDIEVEEENIEENSFMKKLKKVDISEIKVIRFFPKESVSFTVRAKNLIRIVVLIADKTGKTSFKKGELNNMYDYIIKNYKSDLSRREYDKIRSSIKDFIDEGGEIEIVKK